ncbi:unnamed protein product [Nezara viridula]|uniref:F-box domain-containing protein n=1 Tax=Nezara viridula TaxID=85310 RepID=A0A9P0H5L5_NEZVI|nr:unnamed protein product [Nezara viridula]
MSTSSPSCEEKLTAGINDLPNELLEYIISLLPPYQDLENCMVVCKRWYKNVQSVIRHRKIEFHRAISNFNIQWENNYENPKQQIITKRYSHSACSHENAMYVFGGCTCTSTTFNDLWKLDLSTRQWQRLLTMGSYPSPKACASLVYYNHTLILFGGWTHPSPYPLHQAWRTFNELHLYDISANRWNCITSPTTAPPSMAGHAATVHGDSMVVFGGLHGHNGGSNDIWCLNLLTYTWAKKETVGDKPHPRYGHSQIPLDDFHLLILGGWGGPPNVVMNDIWLLTMNGRHWTWTPITVENQQWAASHLWCHPACKVEDYVVVFSRNPVSTPPPLAYSRWTSNSQIGINQSRRINANEPRDHYLIRPDDGAGPSVDRDVNVNGRRGNLVARYIGDPANIRSESLRHSYNSLNYLNHMSAFRAEKPQISRHREKQLDALKRMEMKLKTIRPEQAKKIFRPVAPKMAMFVLDISKILSPDHKVTWLPIKSVAYGSPESTILYTLVKGNGELILFGGIKRDAGAITNQSGQTLDMADTVSNSLYFISAPQSTI